MSKKVQKSLDGFFKKVPSNKYAPTTQPVKDVPYTQPPRKSKSPPRQLSQLSAGTTLAAPSTGSLSVTTDLPGYEDARPTSRGPRTEGVGGVIGGTKVNWKDLTALEARGEVIPATQVPLSLPDKNSIESQFLMDDDFTAPHNITHQMDFTVLGHKKPQVALTPTPSKDTLAFHGGSSSATLVESTELFDLASSHPLPPASSTAHTLANSFPQRFLSANADIPPSETAPLMPPRYVFLPWSPKHQYRAPNGRACSHWDRVISILKESVPNITTSAGIADLIRNVQPDVMASNALDLRTLVTTLDSYLPPNFRQKFIGTTLPWMVRVLEAAPKVLPPTTEGLRLLQQGEERAAVLSQVQVATLLVCGFFSLMPYRYHPSGLKYRKGEPRSSVTGNGPDSYGATLPSFNFNFLFGASYRTAEMRPQTPLFAKISCLLNYFSMMADNWTSVVANKLNIEVVRCMRSQGEIRASFASAQTNLLPPLVIESNLLIENAHEQLQADFANQYLGGGVLGKGCVQEEIRMMICPELLVGLLLCEPLRSREAVIISGCAQYSMYTGYAREFAFAGPATVPSLTSEERDVLKMRNVAVVAFDALNYHTGGLTPAMQFEAKYIDAEVVKAFVAFSGNRHCSLLNRVSAANIPIATGHWGCGAFGGDRELKFLIQLCAAGFASRRPVTYCTFGDKDFAVRCAAIYKHLCANAVTTGALYKVIVQFAFHRHQYRVNSIFDYLLC